METATSCCYVVVLLLGLFLYSKRLFLLQDKTTRLPPCGPLPIPIGGHLHLLRQPLHQSLAGLATRHGPLLLLRFGSRPVLLVSSLAAAEECLTTNDVVFANRPLLLSGQLLNYNTTTLAAAPYGPHWRNLRRLSAVHLFSHSRLAALAPLRAAETRSLLRHLHLSPSDAAGFRRVEMKSLLFELTINMMMEIISGKRYFGETATAAPDEGRRFRRVMEEIFYVSSVSSLEDFVPLLRWVGVNGVKKRMARLAKDMDGLFQEMVDERRRHRRRWGKEDGGGEEKKTIVDVMLSLQEEDPVYYTDDIIKGIILVLIAAGTDTTAVTMEWAMSLLLNHPEALEKACTEIESHVGHEHLVSDSDLPHLHYLESIIKETLRLFPAGPLLVPHEASAECNVGGFDIPRGTMLLINAYAIHRDPKVWEDPTEFKPERFEGGEGERYKFLPYGSGRRACPGEGLATRLMGLVLGSLIQCFEWKRVGEEEVDLTEGEGLAMPKAVPLEALCKPRQAMINILSQLQE